MLEAVWGKSKSGRNQEKFKDMDKHHFFREASNKMLADEGTSSGEAEGKYR